MEDVRGPVRNGAISGVRRPHPVGGRMACQVRIQAAVSRGFPGADVPIRPADQATIVRAQVGAQRGETLSFLWYTESVMPSFLQTHDWLSFQKSLGRRVWRLDDGYISTTIVRHDVRLGKNYLYIPHGPVLELEAGTREHVRHFARLIRGLARDEGSIFVKYEPLHDAVVEVLKRNGMDLRHSSKSLQPGKTVLMDLAKSEDELLSAMHHKTRYNIGVARRKGVIINELPDADAFLSLLEETTEREGFRSHPPEYYRSLLSFFARSGGDIKTRLFGALYEGAPVAAAIVLEHDGVAYYLHGASARRYRNAMAPHLLHWELLMRYRGAGFKYYDFWGIDAERYPGVSRFKLSWGGRVVEYPGSFDMPISGFWHWLWKRT